METLNIDEVMALQMAGFSTEEILRTDLDAFDRLYNENPRLEELINKANDILDRQEKLGITSISCQNEDFPARLLAIGSDCPPVIHCKGNLDLLKTEKSVAVIGARAADREGNAKAYQLGAAYTNEGNVIVSGLALGCDSAAHCGCMEAGGRTVAIVGNGLDICHPRENKSLEEAILAADGLLLSEQPIGIKANPTRLVARNRLQTALSNAVILAQCPAHSGSLHTMRFARQYRKACLAATFPRRTEANAGNYVLLDANLARPI